MQCINYNSQKLSTFSERRFFYPKVLTFSDCCIVDRECNGKLLLKFSSSSMINRRSVPKSREQNHYQSMTMSCRTSPIFFAITKWNIQQRQVNSHNSTWTSACILLNPASHIPPSTYGQSILVQHSNPSKKIILQVHPS